MPDTGTLTITLLDVLGQPATDDDTDIQVQRALDGRILIGVNPKNETTS